MASKDATVQVFSQIYSRSKEHCRFLITPVASNVKFKRKKPTDEYMKWVAQESTPVALTTREIESASEEDPELQTVRECLLSGRWRDI